MSDWNIPPKIPDLDLNLFEDVLLSQITIQAYAQPPIDESTIEGAYEAWRRKYGGFMWMGSAWSRDDDTPPRPTPREYLTERGFTEADVDALEERQEQEHRAFQERLRLRHIEDRANASMTVSKLIEVLQQLPGDMPVVTDDNDMAGNDCVDARVINDDQYAGDVLLLTRFGEA